MKTKKIWGPPPPRLIDTLQISTESFNLGLEAAAALLQEKADKWHAEGNPTATIMARIFEEQVGNVMALKR